MGTMGVAAKLAGPAKTNVKVTCDANWSHYSKIAVTGVFEMQSCTSHCTSLPLETHFCMHVTSLVRQD